MFRFIGLDISISSTGYAAFDIKGDLLLSGVVSIKKDINDAYRFDAITKRLFKIFDFNYHDFILIENYAYSASGQITRIAELTGVIKHFLYMSLDREKIFVCSPSTLKKFTTGKGNCHKNLMMKAAWQKWKFDSNNDNEVDAYALGKLCHAFFVGSGSELAKYEQECIVSLAKTNEVDLNEIRKRGHEIKKTCDSKREPRNPTDPYKEAKEKPRYGRRVTKKSKD